MKCRNILLVDHTGDARVLIRAIEALDEKIKSTVENNPFDALRKLNETDSLPDLIFLDYHMPYIEGSEYLQLLRSIKGLRRVPVVLYCGHSSGAVKNAASKHTEVWFIEKQRKLSIIAESLREIIRC